MTTTTGSININSMIPICTWYQVAVTSSQRKKTINSWTSVSRVLASSLTHVSLPPLYGKMGIDIDVSTRQERFFAGDVVEGSVKLNVTDVRCYSAKARCITAVS